MGSPRIPAMMKALVKKDPVMSYTLEDIEVPQPTAAEVLIKVEATSICGSDIALYNWNEVARAIADLPFIPGHESAGEVVKAGPDASLQVGDRVAVENHFFCGSCYQCRHDRGDICLQMGQFGHGRKTTQGGCSQYCVVDSKYCYKLKTDISFESAALLEPLGVAHNAMEQLEVTGEAVLIIGAGAIGILACAVAKSMGATRVLITDPNRERLGCALAMGADRCIVVPEEDIAQVIREETDGVGIGRICEMSGAAAMVNTQFSLLRKAGMVVMVGLPKQPLHVENVLQDIVFKSLTLKSIHGRRIFHTWEASEQLVAQGHVDISKVITHRIPMSQFETAFEVLFSGNGIKIVLDPSQ